MIVVCPSCSSRFYYDEQRFKDQISKRLHCPQCQQHFEVGNPNMPSQAGLPYMEPFKVAGARYELHTQTPGWVPYGLSEARLLIGRSEGHIQTYDPTCSTRHAEIGLDDEGRIWITDLHSTNGTWVHEKRIEGRVELQPDEIFRCGTYEFMIKKIVLRVRHS